MASMGCILGGMMLNVGLIVVMRSQVRGSVKLFGSVARGGSPLNFTIYI